MRPLQGDPAQLRQIFTNLLMNAFEALNGDGAVKIAASALHEEAPAGSDPQGPMVQVEVTDNGPGLPPELSGRVFERFARGDASRTRSPDAATGSTGLGLAIVAAVVEAHHGRVTVSSQPGRTQFTVHLPLASLVPASQPGPGPDMRAPG